jgi:hypothetical protein
MGAKSKDEALIEKANTERAAQRMELLAKARKSVEIAGRLMFSCANRLDACAESSEADVNESDVQAMIAASSNCSAAAHNMLNAIVLMKPTIQVVGETGGGIIV